MNKVIYAALTMLLLGALYMAGRPVRAEEEGDKKEGPNVKVFFQCGPMMVGEGKIYLFVEGRVAVVRVTCGGPEI